VVAAMAMETSERFCRLSPDFRAADKKREDGSLGVRVRASADKEGESLFLEISPRRGRTNEDVEQKGRGREGRRRRLMDHCVGSDEVDLPPLSLSLGARVVCAVALALIRSRRARPHIDASHFFYSALIRDCDPPSLPLPLFPLPFLREG